MSTNKDVINSGNLNIISSAMQRSRLGDGLALIPRTIIGAVTSNVMTLPNSTTDRSKARRLLRVYARAATSTGYKTPVTPESAPSAGEVAINPTGDVLFNATDAVTDAEVTYIPVEGTYFQDQVIVSGAGVAVLASNRTSLQILSASLDADSGVSSAGSKTIIARGGSPSAGEAALSVDGTQVNFNGTDAGSGGTATIEYYADPGTAYGPFGEKLAEDYPEP